MKPDYIKPCSRSIAVDNAKAICLLFILFCHIPIAAGTFHNYIFSFHVPIFFFIAGIFYKERPLIEVIKNSFRTLLLPYILFNLLIIGIWIGFSIHKGIFNLENNFLSPLFGMILGSTDSEAPYRMPGGPSWFLLTLFIDRILIIPLIKFNYKVRFLYGLLLITVFIVLTKYFHWTIFSIDSALLGLIFLYIGFWGKPFFLSLINLRNRYKILLLVVCLLLIPLIIKNDLALICAGSFGNNIFLFIIGGISGSLLVILLSSFISSHPKIFRTLISTSTFFICCHMMIMEYVMLIYRKLSGLDRDFIVFDKLIITIFTLIIFYSIVYLYKKSISRIKLLINNVQFKKITT